VVKLSRRIFENQLYYLPSRSVLNTILENWTFVYSVTSCRQTRHATFFSNAHDQISSYLDTVFPIEGDNCVVQSGFERS